MRWKTTLDGMKATVLGAAIAAALLAPAAAQNSRIIESEVDPALFRIDETRYLGAKPDPSLAFRDDQGKLFTLADLAGQPYVLVLSYYTCNGTCELINKDLAGLLKDVTRLEPGKDYRLLTVSFDTNDTPESIAKFRASLEMPKAFQDVWRFALPATGDEAKKLAESIGFKYFWSPRDHVFLHPGVFVFLSSEGRVVRYLYAMNTRPFDVDMALIDAKEDKLGPAQMADFALSLCYSYNYKEGKYTLNYTFIIGFGSFVFGFMALLVSILAFRRRARKGEIIG
jgi:protein SCO1/2